MILKFAGLSLGALMLPVAAVAADLPSRVAPPVFVPPPEFTWTGFYIGLNGGAGFGSRTPGLSVAAAPVGSFAVTPAAGGSYLASRTSFVGGGQLGYNLQIPNSGFVIGFETDFDYAGVNGNGGGGPAVVGGGPRVAPDGTGRGVAAVGAGLATSTTNVAFFRRGAGEFLGTARARLGYAFDRVLLYGTGGVAYSGGAGGFANGAAVPSSFYTDFASQPAGAAVTPTSALVGFAVGGGIEYALPTASFLNVVGAKAVTLRVEGLYFDFGKQGVVGVSNEGAAIVATGENSFVVARAGINFKF